MIFAESFKEFETVRRKPREFSYLLDEIDNFILCLGKENKIEKVRKFGLSWSIFEFKAARSPSKFWCI